MPQSNPFAILGCHEVVMIARFPSADFPQGARMGFRSGLLGAFGFLPEVDGPSSKAQVMQASHELLHVIQIEPKLR